MDPISLTLGVVGLGMQIFGGMGQASAAKQVASASQDEATQEQGISNVKQQAMELNARRTQMQTVRNTQLARAQGIEAATTQGAQFGSGLQGGIAQTTDQGLFDMSGVNSAVQTGRQIAGYNQAITGDKYKIASAQSTSATDAGYASMGGAIMKAGPIVGAFGKTAFGNSNSLFGGGSPSGYGVG